jgi:hypothetical protein
MGLQRMTARNRRWVLAGSASAAALVLALAWMLRPGSEPAEPGDAPSASLSSSAASPIAGSPLPVREGEQVWAPVGGESGHTLILTVRSVTVEQTCPGRGRPTESPSFGVFVVLDVTATLEGEDGEVQTATPGEPSVVVPLGAETFRVVAPDGTVQEISSTEASWACYDRADLAPPFVAPGEVATGKVVLDSATGHGTVVYRLGEGPGWAWSF